MHLKGILGPDSVRVVNFALYASVSRHLFCCVLVGSPELAFRLPFSPVALINDPARKNELSVFTVPYGSCFERISVVLALTGTLYGDHESMN